MTNRNEAKSHTLPITLAMTAPAIRMVAVEVIAERKPDGDWAPDAHVIYPVLAILAKHQNRYHTQGAVATRPSVNPTHGGMESNGWRFDQIGATLEFDAVIHDAEAGICEASAVLDGYDSTAYRIVPAPWLPEEDSSRLADLIVELGTEAREKILRAAAFRRDPKPESETA